MYIKPSILTIADIFYQIENFDTVTFIIHTCHRVLKARNVIISHLYIHSKMLK